MIMKVLVACEESQEVCKAFRKLGHWAFSCDLVECSGGHPEWHIIDDVFHVLNGYCHFVTSDGLFHSVSNWDLIIAHPPCTYLSNAGARWLYPHGILNEYRYSKGLAAKSFFLDILSADAPRIAVENPIPSKIFHLPPPSQIIQPFEFGHPYSKKTCLWLKGLPLLVPTDFCFDHIPYCTSGSYSKSHDPKYKGASRKGGSARSRSRTFPGIAFAMAAQWGCSLGG